MLVLYILYWDEHVGSKEDKKDMDVLAEIWEADENKPLICPNCGHNMIVVQLDPIQDDEEAYVPYDTIIECSYCDHKIRAESFSILGGVRSYDSKKVEIASWSPSGSRVVSRYEHMLDLDLLEKLKKSGELKEFLVVNKRAIQVIG